MEEIRELPHERVRNPQDGGIMDQLADETGRRYVPIPRFEDGEPVSKGCEVDGGIVDSWCVWNDGSFNLYDEAFYCIQQGDSGEFVRRPESRVLDADGVKISVGDTVYLLPCDHCGVVPLYGFESGVAYEVVKNRSDDHMGAGRICITDGRGGVGYPLPEQVTHREPDSLEKLRDDMDATLCQVDDLQEFVVRLTALMERGA